MDFGCGYMKYSFAETRPGPSNTGLHLRHAERGRKGLFRLTIRGHESAQGKYLFFCSLFFFYGKILVRAFEIA